MNPTNLLEDKICSPDQVRSILIINVHSALNAGDSALVKMNIQQLHRVFPKAAFTISANYPEENFYQSLPGVNTVPSAFNVVGVPQGAPLALQLTRFFFGLLLAVISRIFPALFFGRFGSRLRWQCLFKAYHQADLVAAVSGNQLLSMGKYGWPFPLTAFSVFLAHLFNKPFYVMPQSIGPLRRKLERSAVRYLYGKARLVFLRDLVSIRLAEEIGLPGNKVLFAPDPAFALPQAGREEALQILSRYGYNSEQPSVGVTVIAPIARTLDNLKLNEYYQTTAKALDTFVRRYNARIFLFSQVIGPTVREDDRNASRELVSLLPADTSQVVIVDEALAPEQLKACYGCMDLMIASRLHSGIFSMGAGIPTLFIGYFSKTRGLLQAMDMEEWMVELGRMDGELLVQKLLKAWENRSELAAETLHKALMNASAVWQVGTLICKDYCGE